MKPRGPCPQSASLLCFKKIPNENLVLYCYLPASPPPTHQNFWLRRWKMDSCWQVGPWPPRIEVQTPFEGHTLNELRAFMVWCTPENAQWGVVLNVCIWTLLEIKFTASNNYAFPHVWYINKLLSPTACLQVVDKDKRLQSDSDNFSTWKLNFNESNLNANHLRSPAISKLLNIIFVVKNYNVSTNSTS